MADLSLNNVFDISVSAPGAGVGLYNSSNLAVFTHEPYGVSFGTDGYKLFVEPGDIATDFGSDSTTAALVNSIFSQKPNIRANSGYCVVIPMIAGVQTIGFSETPDEGSLQIQIGADTIPAIAFNQTAADFQAAIRGAASSLEHVTVTGSFAAGFTITMKGIYGPVALLSVVANTLEASNVPVVVTPTVVTVGEKADEALVRADSLVHFFGAVFTVELSEADILAAALVLSPMRKMAFFLGSTEADVNVGGKLDKLRQNNYQNSRGMLRIDTVLNGLKFCAAYASRGLSVDFAGNNTTLTMHLKDLVGITADQSITQTILNKAQAAGADVYVSFRGVAKTFTSGENAFFDDVYNILAFVEALQVAEFNTLAQVSTKIPQTEGGMDVLKGSARMVCEQFVRNQFLAPGEWTSPVTFGNQEDFFANISQRGYFIYSSPVALQSVVARESRTAPLMQIAIKYAGANHSGSIIVNINK